MLLYKKTFENTRVVNHNFPVEDQFYAGENEAIIADGVTRDPFGVGDLSSCSIDEMIEKYPRPSGSEMAAREVVKVFVNMDGTLKEKLEECNKSLKTLNDKYIKKCDYLDYDYYCSVVSCIKFNGNILNYAFICDCGVIVYDKFGNIKFQTEDEKALYSDPYIRRNVNIPWTNPEARAFVRKEYRNNLNNIQDGKCVSYGALNGQKDALEFVRYGSVNLAPEDRVAIYSDGMVDFLKDKDFIDKVLNFNENTFEEYVNNKAQSDYEKYGKEKTIILYKV